MIRLLHVDDDETILELTRDILEDEGDIAVHTCSSVTEAFTKYDMGSFDVILSDYQMPEIDGLEFLSMVRTGWGDIPFCIFTGVDGDEMMAESINAGADLFLQKGGEARSMYRELRETIRQLAVGRRKMS